uniref:Cadherin-7-like n=1 Tax=Gouania willdenowi TaxID=441366 RepID=A0A8C5EZ69_GOUWI
MNSLVALSILSMFVLLPWEETGCGAMRLNTTTLPQVSDGAAAALPLHRRRRRSWVWNQFFVLEEYTGEEPLYVGKLHSDLDKGDGEVKYVLTGEGATSIFTIDEETGDIHATKKLDREQQAYYTLRAQARDRHTDRPLEPESQFVIKVQDINDNEPKFLDGPYTARVAERSPIGTSVVTVVATDFDDPTYGHSARLAYSILQGHPYFSVEPKTGVVRTALPDMDREVRDRYLLVIQAKDMIGQMGGLSGTTSVTVILTDVNDNPPHFPQSYQFRVPESVLVTSVVAKVRAMDQDVGPNAEMDYRILDGDGTFRILTDQDTQAGLVTLYKPLDFETKSSYTLRIEASNRYVDTLYLSTGSFTDETTVKLLVENVDEPPVFSSPVNRMKVSEAAPVGSSVGTVVAHDPDSLNSPIRYSIDRQSDVERYFDIHSSSGLIRTNRHLDREISALHNITVVATESCESLDCMVHIKYTICFFCQSHVGKAVVLISVMDVNDNAPTFATEYQTFVCENATPGQVYLWNNLGHMCQTQGLGFTLRDNNDNTASILTLRGGFLQQVHPLHFLPVVISDGGSPSLSSTNTLTITVCNCDTHGNQQHCSQGILSAGGIVVVIAAIRHRRQEPLLLDDERDIRENIVRYDDEGGGEEDTEAFNLFTLRHPNQTYPTAQDTTDELAPPALLPSTSESKEDRKRLFQEFISDRLQEADVDLAAPPYDSLQTYAFEGNGSLADSLSSLDSLNSSNSLGSEQSYDFLGHWGPRFKKLADLYEQNEELISS